MRQAMLIANRLEEVLIAVPNEHYDRALAELASAGILHVDEPKGELSKLTNRGYRHLMLESSELKSKLEGFFKLAGLEPSTVPGVKIEVSTWEETFLGITKTYENLEKRLEKEAARASEISAKIAEIEGVLAALEPLKGLSSDLREAWNGASIRAAVGTLQLKAVEQAELILKGKEQLLYVIEQVGEDQAIVSFAGAPDLVRETASELSRSTGWKQFIPPADVEGSPAKASDQLRELLGKLSKELEDIRADVRSHVDELKDYYTKVSAMSEVFKFLAYSARTDTTSFIYGFVDSKDSKRLRESLDRCCNGAYVVMSLGYKRGESYVPSKIELPGYFKWFENIVELYGTPSNNEIVPTVFMAIIMPIIFGLMFPDIGHGLLVLLFAIFYMMPRSRNVAKVAAVLGAAGMITGFLAGEFFGPIPAHAVGLDTLWRSLGFKVPPLESPLEAALSSSSSNYTMILFNELLDLSFWIGGFMLTFGNLLGVADDIISHDYEDLVSRRLPLTLLFLAADLPFLVYFNAYKAGYVIEVGLFTLGRGGPMEAFVFYGGIASLIWLIVGDGAYRAAVGEGFKIDPYESFLGIFEGLITALGNTISFLRIMGLSLAHSGLMIGFTVLYYVLLTSHPGPLNYASAIVVYIIGNLLTAGLEGIVAFAHDLRLHFYEWFGKFFRGSGIPFTPIRVPGVTFVIPSAQ